VNKPDYDDPEVQNRWCEHQRTVVSDYLRSQEVKHGSISECPAWHVAPYVALWAIESLARPGSIGWWVISGDLPTDYISSADVANSQHPRMAIRAIAERWLKNVNAWNTDEDYSEIKISANLPRAELASLLKPRAELLIKWVDDDEMWDEEWHD